jgi:hypothetical protein
MDENDSTVSAMITILFISYGVMAVLSLYLGYLRLREFYERKNIVPMPQATPTLTTGPDRAAPTPRVSAAS